MTDIVLDDTVNELILDCYRNLAMAYQKSGDLVSSDKYIAVYEAHLGGRSVEYGDSLLNEEYISIGTSYVVQGNLKSGYEYYEKAIYNDKIDITFYGSTANPPIYSLDTTNSNAYYLMGLAYINKGGFELQHMAVSYLEHAIELNDKDPRYYDAIGYFYRSFSNENSDFEKAIMYLNKAIEIDPNYKRAYGNLYYIYLSGEYADFDKAMEYSKKSEDANGL